MSILLSKEQQRVYDWLKDDLGYPVFAGAYKGAIGLLQNKPDGYITFVSHAGRDLMNRLASTIAGVESGRVQYQQHLDNIQKDWRYEWGASGSTTIGEEKAGHLIPVRICQTINTLVKEHESGRHRSSDADILFFSTFLDYSDKDKIPKNFLAEWQSAKNWFLSHAHLRPKDFGRNAEDKLCQHFQNLDGYLYIAASSQYERIKGLNEILEETNG